MAGTSDTMEKGEEPIFTHTEETKWQLRCEEHKAKKTKKFKIAKKTCQLTHGDQEGFGSDGEVVNTVADSLALL